MKRYFTLIIVVLLLFLSACSQQEPDTNPHNQNTTDILNSLDEDETVANEKEQLQNLLDTVTPIADYSLLRKIGDFYSIAIPAALSTNPTSVEEQLLSLQSEINFTLDTVITAEVPTGFALQDNWDGLSARCLSLRNNIEKVIQALQDNDSSRVLELRDISGNTDIVEEALVIQNMLSANISELQEEEDKLNIKVMVDYDDCLKKAAKYARYYFGNSDISEDDLFSEETPVVLDDVPGKHYSFTLPGNEDVVILISVEDCSIICREIIPGGYKDNYVNDEALPAEETDIVMPDIIGMDYNEAKKLLDSMGIQYNDGGGMDTDKVPEGTVAHCYPSPGNAISNGDVVNIVEEIEVETNDSLSQNSDVSTSSPFSNHSFFSSGTGHSVSVEVSNGIPLFTIDDVYVGEPTDVFEYDGVVYYDLLYGEYFVINLYPNDEYIRVQNAFSIIGEGDVYMYP